MGSLCWNCTTVNVELTGSNVGLTGSSVGLAEGRARSRIRTCRELEVTRRIRGGNFTNEYPVEPTAFPPIIGLYHCCGCCVPEVIFLEKSLSVKLGLAKIRSA